ncbi:MAG TPA: hypothetical protein VHY37_11740 [Tepidisphaeraceae bacterium]|nr:hypothetical protein [Tepidisphaeraceae bacterium]
MARSSATMESTTKPTAKPADDAAQKKTGLHVPRAHGICGHCQHTISPGEKFTAALRETPQGFERLDLCAECRKQNGPGGFDPAELLCYWQTVMPAPAQQKKNLLVDDEVLCTLFERLGEATEPVKVQFRFVLGLILMRKRLVIYESTRHDADKDIWLVHMKGSQSTLELIDPKLSEQQVSEVSQLGQILSEE